MLQAEDALERVLVVDDEPLVGDAISRLLDGIYEVVVARNGAQALARLRRSTSCSAT